MNDNSVSSNSNNLNFRINITKLLQSKFFSQSPIAYRRNYMFGDDEKNHRKLKPLIVYDDITDRQQSMTSSSSSSSYLKKINSKLTQSTEADNQIENTTSFYTIISKYYDYYNNQPTQREKPEIPQNPVKKIERLYTEQNEQISNQQIKRKSTRKQEEQKSKSKKLNPSYNKNKQLF
ncbi:unnamed protein product [Paramecium octaurelia]|uniref:Uncharacterized protein n=1 Tax=Paramecium octaurelia TaxID=43137 RepID=A0A8S1TMU8_PAROT|nr:unnamed protein product [Paramecium octaurelia]